MHYTDKLQFYDYLIFNENGVDDDGMDIRQRMLRILIVADIIPALSYYYFIRTYW